MYREKITVYGGESTYTLRISGPKKQHGGQFLEFSFFLLYPDIGPKVGNVETPVGTDKREKVLTKACPIQSKDQMRAS